MISRELYALVKLMHEQWILGPFLIFSNGPGNEAKCALECVDISEVLQNSANAKMKWLSNFIVIIFASLFLSLCLRICFLSVARC